MKLLYASAPSAPVAELKRLLLLADELVFMDRPSVSFGNWGTVGYSSPMRGASLGDGPVTLAVEAPPSGPAVLGYERYIKTDLENAAFRDAFLNGIKTDPAFAAKFIKMDASYGGTTGAQIHQAVLEDPAISKIESLADLEQTGELWRVGTPQERRATLGLMLTSASIELTSAQVVSAKTGSTPIVENPAFAKLLSLRTTDSSYVGRKSTASAWLGSAIINSVLPDEVVQQASFTDLLSYRKRTKDAHAAFVAEVERVVTVLDQSDLASVVAQTPALIAQEVTPKVREYRDELVGVRDELFAGLLKSIVRWDVPAVSLAFLSGTSLAAAAGVFLVAAGTAAPAMIDYMKDQRALKRRHALAYLLEVRSGATVVVQP